MQLVSFTPDDILRFLFSWHSMLINLALGLGFLTSAFCESEIEIDLLKFSSHLLSMFSSYVNYNQIVAFLEIES